MIRFMTNFQDGSIILLTTIISQSKSCQVKAGGRQRHSEQNSGGR